MWLETIVVEYLCFVFFKSALSALETSDISDIAGEDLSSDDEDEKMMSKIEDLLEDRRFLFDYQS